MFDYASYAALLQHGYIFNRGENGTSCLRAAALDIPGVRHAFSTRQGGISPAPFATLNLSWNEKDCFANAVENFTRFCGAFGFSYPELTIINHEHGVNVLPVTRRDCGRGFDLPPLPFCDGLVTNDPGVTLVTSHADCGALFFYDPVCKAVGMTHAGWKGTLGRIGEKTVQAMHDHYNSAPENILAAIGPCICRDCFEVDRELGARFAAEFNDPGIFSAGKPGKAQLDLSRAALIQLLDAGIAPAHITMMDACTYHDPALFFSYRRDKGKTGSMSGFIKLT